MFYKTGVKMAFEITFTSQREPRHWEEDLRSIFAASPFSEFAPVEKGEGQWVIVLVPRRHEIVVGFASVAEFQLRLCRHVEIISVTSLDTPRLAIAS